MDDSCEQPQRTPSDISITTAPRRTQTQTFSEHARLYLHLTFDHHTSSVSVRLPAL
jgi:hypothetical protein